MSGTADILVDIALDTGTEKLSFSGVNTDDGHYEGVLSEMSDIVRETQAGGGTSPAQSGSLTIRDALGKWRAKYAATTWKKRTITIQSVNLETGAQAPVIVAKVEKVNITPDGLEVEFRDDSLDKLDGRIPLRVFPDIFPDMPVTTPVELIPIVIGTVSSDSFDKSGHIPAYLVDPHETLGVYRYVAAQHPLKSITKVYNNGTEVDSGDWAVAYANITTDYGTVRMTFIDFDKEQRAKNKEEVSITYDGTGITVDNLESGALETDIPDALKLLLSNLDQTSPLVAGDFASTVACAAQYTAETITLSNNGIAITEWGTKWIDVVDLFAESFNLQFFVNASGKYQMRFDDAQTGTASVALIDSQDIVQGSFELDTPDESVSTLEVSYAYDWARDKPTARIPYNDATEETALGRDILDEAELPCIRSINDAQKIAQIKLFQQRSSRQIVSCRVPAQDLELGDFVSLTHFAGPSTDGVGFDTTLFCVYELTLTRDEDGLYHDLTLLDHPGVAIVTPSDSEEARTEQTITEEQIDIASNVVWTAEDENTVSWTEHDLKIGTVLYTTIAASNTGNMAAKTYIYFDPDVSTAALQTTTTFSTAVGVRKRLVCEAGPGTTVAWIKNRVGWVESGLGGGGAEVPDQVTYEQVETPDLERLSGLTGDLVIEAGKSITLTPSATSPGSLYFGTAGAIAQIYCETIAATLFMKPNPSGRSLEIGGAGIGGWDSIGGFSKGTSADIDWHAEYSTDTLKFARTRENVTSAAQYWQAQAGYSGAIIGTIRIDTNSTYSAVTLTADRHGFFGATPVVKPSAANLAELLTALEGLGLVTDTS